MKPPSSHGTPPTVDAVPLAGVAPDPTITPLHPSFGARVEGVYQHRWRRWDLVMWDDRCVLHRGRPRDSAHHRRVMRRTTVGGEGPTVEPPLATRLPICDGIVP